LTVRERARTLVLVELFWTPARGGSPVRKLSSTLTPGGAVMGTPQLATTSPDSRLVYYLADQDRDDVIELYATEVERGALRADAP